MTRSTAAGLWSGSGKPEFTATSGVGQPQSTGFQYLSGGTRGISTNLDFQNAFDQLSLVRANFVVPLIVEDLDNQGYSSTATYAAVIAQLVSHLTLTNGINKSERGGLAGYKGNKTGYISQCYALNNTDVQLTSQKHQELDVLSNLVEMDEWVAAVLAAGMRAGAPEVGEPLTHKLVRTFGMTQDSICGIPARTDANQLIEAGALFAQTIEGKGTRWERDLTTYTLDDNLAYAEGSTRDAVRFTAYGLRTTLEERFTGIKARPANAAALKDTAAAYLDALNAENILVDSLNREGVLVNGWDNLRVTITGDIATIRVEVYPAVGINFQLNDIYLQLPRSVA
jgi:hypothetical protein